MAKHPGPVLVTGANSGIGLATALRLAKRDWEVWGTVRSAEKARALAKAAAEAGVDQWVVPLVLDVSKHEAVVEAWPHLPDFYGVVNNAGYTELGAVEEVSAAEARAQLDVNLIAPAIVSGCALPGMRRLGAGRIIMVSSIAGVASVLPLNAWYHASKFGLEALSDVLRVEVASFGVKVSIVEPGLFKTGIEDRAESKARRRSSRNGSPYERAYRRTMMLLNLVQRFAPPADHVARVVASALESWFPRRRYLVGLDARATVATQAVAPRALIDLGMRLASDLSTRSGEALRGAQAPGAASRARRKRARKGAKSKRPQEGDAGDSEGPSTRRSKGPQG
jgi:NAD(P)-dependent dehydrogenase (short-subunit alcohol dehydrogenase family)